MSVSLPCPSKRKLMPKLNLNCKVFETRQSVFLHVLPYCINVPSPAESKRIRLQVLSPVCDIDFNVLDQPAKAFIGRLVGWSGDKDAAKGVLKPVPRCWASSQAYASTTYIHFQSQWCREFRKGLLYQRYKLRRHNFIPLQRRWRCHYDDENTSYHDVKIESWGLWACFLSYFFGGQVINIV